MKVKVTTFKPGGKHYTSGEYESLHTSMHAIYSEVRMRAVEHGLIPGLADGQVTGGHPWVREWVLLVEVPEHADNVPHLIPLARDGFGIRVTADEKWFEAAKKHELCICPYCMTVGECWSEL